MSDRDVQDPRVYVVRFGWRHRFWPCALLARVAAAIVARQDAELSGFRQFKTLALAQLA